MKFLDFPTPDGLIGELKKLEIKSIKLVGNYFQLYTKDKYRVPIIVYKMVATATKEGLDYIIRYEETIGSDVAYFDDRMKEFLTKTEERVEHFTNALKESGFEVQTAMWSID